VALVLALVLAFWPSMARPAEAMVYTVDTVVDENDGSCSDGDCSLRDATILANSNPGPDTINFDISGCGGVCTIQPTSELPSLSGGGTTVDGYTQPGATEATDGTPATLLIEIDGTNAGVFADGFSITSADNEIKGLVINRFSWYGVSINAMDNTISGNYIGTDASGTVALGNGEGGVRIYGTQNTVGGDTPGERNVISGNDSHGILIPGYGGTTYNTVSGNYIGTDASGTGDLGNTLSGVFIYGGAQNNTIGGATADERNVISGNDSHGVYITSDATHNTVSGNYIGTDASGTAGLGNGDNGVCIYGAQNTVGGDTADERNVISDNSRDGVRIVYGDATGNTVSGNYIGTDANGTTVLGNTWDGVSIHSGARNNTVGGATGGERNVISGNGRDGVHIFAGDDNTVSGNYIGTDASGMADSGNTEHGVYIDGDQNTVGGDTPGERNVISGNDLYGVWIYGGAQNNTVSGNYIGTNASGMADLGNTEHGVYISYGDQNTVGGDTPGERNVISGNDLYGVYISGDDNTVSGNYIGTDASCTAGLGNTYYGVFICQGAQNNTVGPDNVIAHNGSDGVAVDGSTTISNTITQNSIFSNDIGIDLSSGANGDIAAPIIVTTTVGSVNVVGTACAGCTVEVFENGDTDGEGETYVEDTTANASGAFTVTVSSLS
jgi:titin